MNLVKGIGSLIFLVIMAWGAFTSLSDDQISGLTSPNMPISESLGLSNSTMLILGLVPAAFVILQIYLKVGKLLRKHRSAISNLNNDTPDDKPGLSHLDEDYMEKYAANFRAEQAAQVNRGNASPPPQSPAAWPQNTGPSTGFGRRK